MSKLAVVDGLELNTVGLDFIRLSIIRGNWLFIVQAFVGLSVARFTLVHYVFPHIYKAFVEKYDDLKCAKFSESLWFFIYYFCLALWGYLAFDMVGWFNDPALFFKGYPNHELTPMMKLFMGVETGYYFSSLVYLAFESRVKHKDLPMMVLHHVTCIIVIEGSYFFRFQRIAIFSTWLHDLGDVFLESSKSFHYLGYERAKNIDFSIFAVVFTVTRCVIYSWKVIYYSWNYGAAVAEPIVLPYLLFFNIMISVLQTLDFIWCLFVWAMAIKAFKSGDVSGDIRSEAGSDVDDEKRMEEVEDDVVVKPKRSTPLRRSTRIRSNRA